MGQRRRLAALAVVMIVGAGALGHALRAEGAQAPPGDAKAGAVVFGKAGCGACHALTAAGAKGAVGPDLDRAKPSYEQIVAVVSNGRGAMPPFKGKLSTKEIADVATYIAESVRAKEEKPGSGARAKSAAAVRVVLGEWLLLASPRILPAGRVVFVVRNKGDRPHALVVMRSDPSPGRVGAVPLLRPGRVRRLTLSLRAGVYLLFSNRLPDLRKGMLVTLSVRAKGGTSATPVPEPGGPPGGGPSSPPGGAATTGAQLFAQAGCGSCHTLAAAGATGTLGPNLDQLKPSAAQVASVVKSGRGAMPSFAGRLTDAQIGELAAYVASAAGTGAATSPPPPTDPGGSYCGPWYCGGWYGGGWYGGGWYGGG